MKEITINFEDLLIIIENDKKKNQEASTEFTNGLVINSKNSEVALKSYIVELIFKNIENFSENYPHLIDSNGCLKLRKIGKYAYILIFKKNCDIEELRNKAENSMKILLKERKIRNELVIKVYDGLPLDTTKHIVVEVTNPNPKAEEKDYKVYGEILKFADSKGKHIITYSSINNFLPALEQYYKEKKNIWKKRDFSFYIDPNEENKAAPQYRILTKKYAKPSTTFAVQKLKEKYPLAYHKRKQEEELLIPPKALRNAPNLLSPQKHNNSSTPNKTNTNIPTMRNETSFNDTTEESPINKRIPKENQLEEFEYLNQESEDDFDAMDFIRNFRATKQCQEKARSTKRQCNNLAIGETRFCETHSEKNKCQGKTKQKKKCKQKPLKNNLYCKDHQDQAPNNQNQDTNK